MSVGATIRIVCDRSGKQVYGTLARADLFRLRLEDKTGRPYRVYVCEFCGYYHLTSHRRSATS